MSIVCMILGVLYIILAIIFAAISHLDGFISVMMFISCVLTAAILFYIGSLGFSKVSVSEYQEKTEKLEKELSERDFEFKTLLKVLKIDDFDKVVENERIKELSLIEIDDMEIGFPVVLKEAKKLMGKKLEVGTKATLQYRAGEEYHIQLLLDGEETIVRCKKEDIENAYLYYLENKKNKEKD